MAVQITTAGQRCVQPRVPARAGWPTGLAIAALLTTGLLGCNGVADEGKLPPEIPDPTTLRTPAGAMARYRGAIEAFGEVLDRLIVTTGVLTDEMADLGAPLGTSGAYTGIDSRTDLSHGFEEDYKRLHRLRAEAREARGFLTAYAPDSSTALAGHLYALEAYADILLADVFCSGIPLSTVEFDGNYTLRPGSTTAEVYDSALALFDSAAALVGDSVRLQAFAAVGRGRALAALERYTEAAAAVAAVPDGYQYLLTYAPAQATDRTLYNISFDATVRSVEAMPGVANSEGITGLDYRSSGDPRISVQSEGTDVHGQTLWFPVQYPTAGSVTFTVASGVEARLLEAEAALQANPDDGTWLTTLNALRTDGTFDEQPTPDPNDDPAATDTLWHAGTGGVAGLAPLQDPGTSQGRVALVFRERAFWLFLTAHRQGDLRRLVRNYGQTPNAAYPNGAYSGGTGRYGGEVVAPVPESEKELNPKYSGCRNLGA